MLEKQQAEARIKKLLQMQRTEERKARNHRLCKRGGEVEKLLPELAAMTEEQFHLFVEKTLKSGFAARAVKDIFAMQPPCEAVQDNGNNADCAASASAPKPIQAAYNGNGNKHNGAAQAARVAG
jgi:hypothetical protein